MACTILIDKCFKASFLGGESLFVLGENGTLHKLCAFLHHCEPIWGAVKKCGITSR